MTGRRLSDEEKLDREQKGILMEALDYLFKPLDRAQVRSALYDAFVRAIHRSDD